MKPQLNDDYAGVEIRLPDGSLLPQKKKRGSKKKYPVAHLSQMAHSVQVEIGDHFGEKAVVDLPIDREGALMACYGMACLMAQVAEDWLVRTIGEMKRNNVLPNSQEMKEMMTVVKGCQDAVMNTWSKAYAQSGDRKAAGTGIHAPMLNQFFKVENLITAPDGRAPRIEDILKGMHDLKVTSMKSVKELQSNRSSAKALGDEMGSNVEIVMSEQDKEEEYVELD